MRPCVAVVSFSLVSIPGPVAFRTWGATVGRAAVLCAAALPACLWGCVAASSDTTADDVSVNDVGEASGSADANADSSTEDGTGSETDTGTLPDVTPPPAPVCGDGLVEGDEACDDGSLNSDELPNACRTNCEVAFCGDDTTDIGEECDDGNRVDDDFCTSACRIVATDICAPCDGDDDCGGERDACLLLPEEPACGLVCRSAEDCPEGFVCADARSLAGAPTRQCLPSAGGCTGCFDPDRDGFGVGPDCEAADCAPSRADIYPGADEVCDGIDNDCDGDIDEGIPTTEWFVDADFDGRGALGSTPRVSCLQPANYVSSADDCNDRDRLTAPAAPELCDNRDNDCDGAVDEGAVEQSFWTDSDGDGYGSALATATASCSPIPGSVTNNRDCNDSNQLVRPEVAETCGNGFDDNCNGITDCDEPSCASTTFCLCADDSFEDNDAITQARPLPLGTLNAVRVCASDSDFYVVSLSRNDTLTVTLTHPVGEGDVDLLVLDAGGRVVDSATSTAPSETLEFTAPSSGTWFVEVRLFGDDGTTSGNGYSLVTSIDAAPEDCSEDTYEPNDTPATPSRVAAGEIPGLRSCPGDADFFGLSLNVGDTLTWQASFDDANGDIDLRLLDPAGSTVVTATTTTDNETLTWTARTAGLYVLRVELVGDSGASVGNDYALTATLLPATSGCTDDSLEDNDSESEPSAVSAATGPLRICPFDRDFFSVPFAAGQTIRISARFAHAGGDIDMRLLDATGLGVATAISTDDDELLEYRSPVEQILTLEVYLYRDEPLTGNSYTLSVD
jgi:cysteine-rich repeat protein